MFDITASQPEQIQSLLRLRLPHATALAFGSRVLDWPFGRGPKPYFDLEDSPLPWRVDITDANDLPPTLRALVEQRGVALQGCA
jgi:hypothetical protein